MRSRGLARAGLGLVTALTFAVSACAGNTDGSGRKAAWVSAPADPSAEATVALTEAATALTKVSFKVRIQLAGSDSVTGAMDPPNKRGRLLLKSSGDGSTLTIHALIIGSALYTKMRFGGKPPPGDDGKWMRMDPSRLSNDDSLLANAAEFDPADAATLVKSVGTADQIDDQTFKGTLDLTRTDGGGIAPETELSQLGDAAKSVPFQAITDDEGRLVAFTVDVPAMSGEPAYKMVVTYSDFGAKVGVKKPPAKNVRKAPNSAYGTLGA